MKIAICGAGAAGVYAAKRLRTNLPDASILLFDADSSGFYAKMRLPEYVAGSLPREKLVLNSPEQMTQWGIELHLGEPVLSIHPASHTLVSVSGEYNWDKLILATGAHAFMPPVPGLEGNQLVHVLRELPDADAIVSLAKPSQPAAVIGGGLLGLEAAWALHSRGMDVSIVEHQPRLLPLQLTESESAALLSQFLSAGFHIHTAARATEFDREGSILSLDNGTRIPASLVLVSAGIRPNLSLAVSAGLKCRCAVVVDDSLLTSAPDIYAAGDCAELDGCIHGLWIAAKDQGESTADIIAGKISSMPKKVYHPKLKIPAIATQ